MKGLILINAYFDGDGYMYQPQRLKEEFFELGVHADIMRNDKFKYVIEGGDGTLNYGNYDFFVYLDKDKYILNALSLSGMRLFNSYESISACDDKMTTYIALSDRGIPMPKTLPGLLCYSPAEKIKAETVEIIEKELEYPLIIKECYGSLGKGVYLVHDRDELLYTLERVKCMPHLLQQFIYTSFGRDMRVMVVGDDVVGAMLRSSDSDFRSNIGAGGRGSVCEVTDEIRDLSIKIARTLGLDYCGIDFLFGENGPIVCEVNSNAFFMEFEKITGINVARAYAQYIINKMKNI